MLLLLLLLVPAAAAVLEPLLLCVPPQPAPTAASKMAMPRAANAESVFLKGFLLAC